MIEIKRALLSVSDKNGLAEFARFLADRGVEILSTGGTLAALKKEGIPAKAIEEHTGFPEMMDGRLKTLHPIIHGGLLALRDNSEHVASMEKHNIGRIDLLVVNLYPFAATVARGADFDTTIENIDIGGPTMLRAAAKNHRFVASVCDPSDYLVIQSEIESKGGVSEELCRNLARKVFNHTASYDAMISGWMNEQAGETLPDTLTMTWSKIQPLRYGENPHQAAAFYRPVMDLAKEAHDKRAGATQLHGKELSFNNMLDFSSALEAAMGLPGPGAVIVKHLNPCGAAMVTGNGGLSDAFIEARKCDPISAFGGVIALSAPCDGKTAELIAENFAEGVIAPDFSPEALTTLGAKKNIRLLKVEDPARFLAPSSEIRQVYDGVLLQDRDRVLQQHSEWKFVTDKKPDEDELRALTFAWRMVKHIKSNAILFCSDHATLGIGAGQMSRVDSVELAIAKAKKGNLDLKGSVVASDAFFPFRDGLDALAAAGARAVIQPGGSVRDQEVIDAANEHGITMVFTGMRHFRH